MPADPAVEGAVGRAGDSLDRTEDSALRWAQSQDGGTEAARTEYLAAATSKITYADLRTLLAIACAGQELADACGPLETLKPLDWEDDTPNGIWRVGPRLSIDRFRAILSKLTAFRKAGQT